MAKKQQQTNWYTSLPQLANPDDQWHEQIQAVTQRFNREYEQAAFELPPEVEAMPVFQDWNAGRLQARIASEFWQFQKPKKKQHWLDIGCGLSFLVYPWFEWEAYFYGQELSKVAQEAVNSRGPQLNSKLFRGVERGPAHHLKYDDNQFDGVIATGFSCYFPQDYWQTVLTEIKRVLKPDSVLIFDVIDPDSELADNWSILETYLGAEVFPESLDTWKSLIKTAGGKVLKAESHELFHLFKVKF
ncbi:class I SAM-dependent methyltransferase [Acaryochloris sp. IP29b_bin.137]|uniref:class I SAM-dependent methyltransferase n=1 Tax=Acaryochloris sp. IP29b_bin.137 TaxID=2969217 RepID=UPI0026296CA1|nr:class I SAM-dependent methyltransferase [Acaryochloris sp. IP29b_bin.137]